MPRFAMRNFTRAREVRRLADRQMQERAAPADGAREQGQRKADQGCDGEFDP